MIPPLSWGSIVALADGARKLPVLAEIAGMSPGVDGGPNMERQDPIVDLSFQLQGTPVPADHGYLLYSAISRWLPWLHGDQSVGIHPIRGQLIGQRQLSLTRSSQVVLRLPATKIPDAIRLAGQRLDLGSAAIVVGVPSVRPLLPHPTLLSRLVVIRGFTQSGPFLDGLQRQLAQLGVTGSPSLLQHKRERPMEALAGGHDAVVRRTLRIRDKEVVGFAVRVCDLGPRDSLVLQSAGLGGRRRFGCGVFLSTPGPKE